MSVALLDIEQVVMMDNFQVAMSAILTEIEKAANSADQTEIDLAVKMVHLSDFVLVQQSG
jgi:hypothetical protein